MRSKLSNKTGETVIPGALYVVSTPIGNLSDISLRALETLRSVHLIAAEDTRHTRKLLSHYDIHKPLVSYHSHNLEQRGRELIEKLEVGESVALVTDAGTPGVSDPGALLIAGAIDRGLPVIVIPGATALIAALVASGLPTHPFAFLGFAPARGPGRRKFFASHASLPMTLVLYESPRRLARTLEDILTSWGDRRIAVARELTKRHEEVFRGTVAGCREHFPAEVKGELTLVVEGASEATAATEREERDWRGELRLLLDTPGITVKDAVERIASTSRVPRRTVYKEALRRKSDT
jgi:16S rRNA (cytidine1402-2'-O)-methyltransferase